MKLYLYRYFALQNKLFRYMAALTAQSSSHDETLKILALLDF